MLENKQIMSLLKEMEELTTIVFKEDVTMEELENAHYNMRVFDTNVCTNHEKAWDIYFVEFSELLCQWHDYKTTEEFLESEREFIGCDEDTILELYIKHIDMVRSYVLMEIEYLEKEAV